LTHSLTHTLSHTHTHTPSHTHTHTHTHTHKHTHTHTHSLSFTHAETLPQSQKNVQTFCGSKSSWLTVCVCVHRCVIVRQRQALQQHAERVCESWGGPEV